MEFSLFNLTTRPDSNITHREVFAQMRSMVSIAEESGFDIAWFAEHHMSNYCIAPSPLTTTAHMAGFTKRIKLGPAVVVMPFYEPLRLIEDIFFVDQLTEGRFVLGLGTGYQPREFEKFGFALDDRMQKGLEVWDALHGAQQTAVIDYHGKHIDISDAALSIEPVQQSIPTFAVGNAPEFRRRIIERGATPMCTPGIQDPAFIGVLRNLVTETCDELGVDNSTVPFAVQRYVFITEDKQEARQAAEQVLTHARLAANMRQEKPEIDGAMLRTPPFKDEPTVDKVLEYSLIGSAESVAERIINDARSYGMTHLSVFMQFAGMPYTQTLRSLERFGDQVVPAVRSAMEQAA